MCVRLGFLLSGLCSHAYYHPGANDGHKSVYSYEWLKNHRFGSVFPEPAGNIQNLDFSRLANSFVSLGFLGIF